MTSDIMKHLINPTKYIALILVAVLLGCNQQEGDHSTDEQGPAEEHTEETLSVELTEQQIDAVNIGIGQLTRLPLKNSVKANGILELPPQNKGDVSALVPGAIQTINVIVGDQVAKGEVLSAARRSTNN
ncbi:MAG: hypothetical protein U5K69_11755 [Balneolaceae bacterium]|nr:hypothetical protein [Balneolaceae bacterium]